MDMVLVFKKNLPTPSSAPSAIPTTETSSLDPLPRLRRTAPGGIIVDVTFPEGTLDGFPNSGLNDIPKPINAGAGTAVANCVASSFTGA